MQDHHQLDVWNLGMDLAVRVYEFASTLPKTEQYGLIAQLQRAAVSVPLNIAEGAGSATKPEFCRFLSYAYRSVKEITTGIELCRRLYPTLPPEPTDRVLKEADRVAGMTFGLMSKLGWSGSGWREATRGIRSS